MDLEERQLVVCATIADSTLAAAGLALALTYRLLNKQTLGVSLCKTSRNMALPQL